MSKFKMLRWIRAMIAAVMCVCMMAGVFAGCSEQTAAESTQSSAAANITYTVVLENKAGTPLSNVTVKVYSDDTMEDLVTVAKTDAEGKVTFTGAAGGYVAVLSGLPDGYSAAETYRLEEQTRIVPTVGTMTDEDMDTVTYSLGDAVMDFSVTAIDGTVYTLSQLLEEKKAVVLNFWYLACDPCKMEFPYVQQAYEQYSDEIALLAMNPVDGTDAEISLFRQANRLTFPMFSCDVRWQKMMRIAMYPTTVVIDRYGNICLIHSGMVTEAETLTRVFEYVISEDYEQQFFSSLADVPAV